VSVDFDYENLEKQRAHGSCLSELQVRRKRVKAVKDRDTAESRLRLSVGFKGIQVYWKKQVRQCRRRIGVQDKQPYLQKHRIGTSGSTRTAV
jgi:hypothetical protein